MAKMIYSKDGMNAVDRESAVQHIGYTSLNGASATALASLKQFGLTTDAGKGMIRLSDLALDLIEPESEEARAHAVAVAAFHPDLFAALRERFPKAPSESNLRAHLVRQGFTSAAVKSIVPAYLGTCEYAASTEETESHVPFSFLVPESQGKPKEQGQNMTADTLQRPAEQLDAQRSTTVAGRRMVFDTEEGEVMFTYPDHLSPESVDDLEEWFSLVTKRLRRATKS